jgi:type II secretory pathway component GspD/PulD (secretin)
MTKPHNNSSRPIKYCFSHYLSLVICLGLFLQANAETEFKIITLQHRFAEEILPAIKPLVGDDGTATAMQNNLIIRTSRNNMAEIEQLISSLDTVRQNLKITIRRNTNNDIGQSRTEIAGRRRIDNVTVETGGRGINKQNGLAMNIENYQSKSNVSNEQFIRVTDGEQAFILVGQSVPYTQEWINLTHRYLGIQRSTAFVNIDTGFAVRPRTIGNQVELEITPRFSQLNRNGLIDFTTLTTIVRVNRDDWLDIAGIMQQKDEVSRAILSLQSNNQTLNNQLLIRVE